MTAKITPLTKKRKRQKFWIFILHNSMKRDGIGRMFQFAKREIGE